MSRTFGDIEAKLEKYGGNPNVVIATPEIKSFKIDDSHDFIVLACITIHGYVMLNFIGDGIYDKLSSQDSVKAVWDSTAERATDIHHQCGLGVEEIIRESLYRRTLDNVTVLMICLKNFKHKLFPRSKQAIPTNKELLRRHPETESAHNSTANRNHVQQESNVRQEMRVLRERTDNQNSNNADHSASNHAEKHHKRTNGLQKEIDNLHGMVQTGKKMVEKELSRTKDLPHSTKNASGIVGKSFSSNNNENKGFDSYLDYFDYIQNSKVNKQRQADSKTTNHFRSGLKGEIKH